MFQNNPPHPLVHGQVFIRSVVGLEGLEPGVAAWVVQLELPLGVFEELVLVDVNVSDGEVLARNARVEQRLMPRRAPLVLALLLQ